MKQFIAHFTKVSFTQFKKDMLKLGYDLKMIEQAYDNIVIPKRTTKGSAGYDFVCPFNLHIGKDSVLIPTGIRAKMDLDYVLMLFPRSSLGFKYGLQLDNSVGIIDSDYYNSDNEGHIMAKVHACKEFSLSAGSRFIQGVFLQYGLANEEDVLTERNGGIGSTDNI